MDVARLVNSRLNDAGLATGAVEVDRPAQCAQRRELLARGGPAGLEEAIGEVEVAPLGRPEARGDHDVAQRGVASARVELAEVHRLEDRVERSASPGLGRLALGLPRHARPALER